MSLTYILNGDKTFDTYSVCSSCATHTLYILYGVHTSSHRILTTHTVNVMLFDKK